MRCKCCTEKPSLLGSLPACALQRFLSEPNGGSITYARLGIFRVMIDIKLALLIVLPSPPLFLPRKAPKSRYFF